MRRLFLGFCILLCVSCSSPAFARRRAVGEFHTIYTLELYTPAAIGANGSAFAVEEKIRAAIPAFNLDLVNSGIRNVQLVLVHTASIDLGELHGLDLLNAAQRDPRVTELADLYAADLVGVWDAGPLSLGTIPSVDAPTPLAGFHLITSLQPAGSHVFTHEVLHNFGVQDDVADGSTATGWARGICRTDPPAFRDVMATCAGAATLPPLVRIVSNPMLTCAGVPCGSGDRNGAAMVRAMAPVLASYRDVESAAVPPGPAEAEAEMESGQLRR